MRNLPRIAVMASLIACSSQAFAADDLIKKGAQQLGKNQFESAAASLRTAAKSAELSPEAMLTLARSYSLNARFHQVLQHSSMAIGSIYLHKLSAQRNPDRSQYVGLYYGEYLAQTGKMRESSTQLSRFIEQKNVAANYRDIARVTLSATKKSAPPSTRDALARTQLAAINSQSQSSRKDSVAQVEQALAELEKSGATLPIRAVTNAIGVYARNGQTQKAFALLEKNDLARPSYEELINNSKVLRFYDPALLGNLASLYQGEAERLLLQLKANARLKSVATFFLVDLYINNHDYRRAASLLPELLASTDLPPAYQARTDILQSAIELNTGKAAKANATLAKLAQMNAQDPALLAETLSACLAHKGKCSSIAALAREQAATSQGERYRSLHLAMGEHYASENNVEKALLEMEIARDKSNKNRIEANDPLLLARLADLYFANKNFSESLEIYFEMSKEFPAVRQLQETGQGVYSTEYRSAGDVKIL